MLVYFSVGGGMGIALYPTVFVSLLEKNIFSVWAPFFIFFCVETVKLSTIHAFALQPLNMLFALLEGLSVSMALVGVFDATQSQLKNMNDRG